MKHLSPRRDFRDLTQLANALCEKDNIKMRQTNQTSFADVAISHQISQQAQFKSKLAAPLLSEMRVGKNSHQILGKLIYALTTKTIRLGLQSIETEWCQKNRGSLLCKRNNLLLNTLKIVALGVLMLASDLHRDRMVICAPNANNQSKHK